MFAVVFVGFAFDFVASVVVVMVLGCCHGHWVLYWLLVLAVVIAFAAVVLALAIVFVAFAAVVLAFVVLVFVC